MSFELTSERLQDIAVSCVTQFMSKQASLNEAIAKEAMDLELNPEQTKRVIEASNTLAYLRQLEKSADRTFEFEVADYGKVMTNMCLPEDMAKQAGHEADEKVKEDIAQAKTSINKAEKDQAQDDKEDAHMSGHDSPEEKQEKRAMLMKGYFKAKEDLEKMAYDEAALCMELVKAAGVVGKDPLALEKLAFIVEEQDLDKTVKLCGVEKRAQESRVFVDRDLQSIKAFYDLYKQAEAFVVKKAETEDFVSRAETVLFKRSADLEKQAFLGQMITGALKGGAHIIGSVVGGLGGFAGRKVKNLATGGLQFSSAATKAGFKSTDEAISAYDKINKTQGTAAAKAKFGGKSPSYVNRHGFTGLVTAGATATAGLGMTHKENVKDI